MSGFASDNYLSQFATSNPSHPSPIVNVAENEEAYLLEIGIPGFTKEEIKIELTDFQLTISGQKMLSQNQKEEYPLKESASKNIRNAFFIAEHINKKNISAKFESGMLIVTLPKLYEPDNHSSLIEID